MSAKRSKVLAMVAFVIVFGLMIVAAKAQPKIAAQAPHSQTPMAATVPKKAEEQFKNIQVLKGIPADQIFPTMQFVAASLGVECEFCHVKGAFEKDDKKPKQTARKMMEMMFAINKDNFDGHREVTCYSCHRGNVAPQAIPAVMIADTPTAQPHEMPAAPTPAEAKQNSVPNADRLLDKYLQAIGGAEAIDKVTSRVMKGTIDFGGKSLPIDIYSKDPEKRISFTHMGEGDSITAFNGREGWLSMSGQPLREMHGSDLDGAAMDADLHLATHFKTMFSEMQVLGAEKVGDHDAYVLIGQREAKPPVRLYFDTQSGLLVRLVRFGETALGWLPTQIDYADYRETGGTKMAYRWTLYRPNGRFTIQLSEMQQNVPVDDAKFVKPAAQETRAPSK